MTWKFILNCYYVLYLLAVTSENELLQMHERRLEEQHKDD